MGVNYLLQGIAVATHPLAILMIVVGWAIGMVVGAAPGIGPTVGMIMLLPVALKLSPENGILLLTAVLVGSGFGNSLPAVLLNIPGTPAAVLACVEGHPFHQKGESGRALLVSLASAVVGQFISILVFILFVVPLAHWGLKLLFPEIFAIVLVGLFSAAAFVNRQVLKGLVAVAIGLLLSQVGPDPITGQLRLTFGSVALATGLSEIPVITGLLAFRQIFEFAEQIGAGAFRNRDERPRISWFPRLKKGDARQIAGPIGWGVAVGTLIGAIPGAGGSVASFLNYQLVRAVARDKSEFGKGSLVGLASVEAPNNAVIGGELIPTFGLGLPGSAPMVVILTLLTAEGIQPGANIIQTNPLLLYATFGGLLVATLVKAVLGYFAIGPAVYLGKLSPTRTLLTATLLITLGVYSLRWDLFDVAVALAMGALGFLLEKFGYSVVAATLAFILGGILESSLRRGLVMTFGWYGFVTRPITLSILMLGVVMALAPPLVRLGSRWYARKRRARDRLPTALPQEVAGASSSRRPSHQDPAP